jgi:hypothetical protein
MAGGLQMLCTKWLLTMLALLLSACASLQPVNDDAARLQEQIRDGEVIAAGDRVRITTRDGTVRVILVSALDGGLVHGYEESPGHDDLPRGVPDDDAPVVDIAIEDIVRIEDMNAVAGIPAEDFRNALFLFAIGVMMIIAAFANF